MHLARVVRLQQARLLHARGAAGGRRRRGRFWLCDAGLLAAVGVRLVGAAHACCHILGGGA
jgi:hypothetical protein